MSTPTPTTDARRPWLLLFIAVCLVAANLRMTITGVGPLLEEIAADLRVPVTSLGALGSIPLLAWAAFSPLAHALSARFGIERAVTGSLLVLATGTLWRSLPGAPINLWIGTGIIGAGLAIGNVLLPAVIKRDFPTRMALVMGVYTALLGGTAGIAAGIAVPLSHIPTTSGTLGWRVALLLTGSLVPVAIVLWAWATRGRGGRHEDPSPPEPGLAIPTRSGRRIWSDRVAWLVAGYMGTQSLIFYVLATWLAPYLTSLGATPAAAGVALMVFQALGIAGSMIVPLILRGTANRWIPALLPAVGLLAWLGMPLAPALMPAWIVIGGLSAGAQLTMSITLMAARARTREVATALSGMSQSVGYLIAAVGPVTFGLLHEFGGGWIPPFGLVWIAAAAQLAIGLAVGKPHYALER